MRNATERKRATIEMSLQRGYGSGPTGERAAVPGRQSHCRLQPQKRSLRPAASEEHNAVNRSGTVAGGMLGTKDGDRAGTVVVGRVA